MFVELLPAGIALPLGIASHAVQGLLSNFVRLLSCCLLGSLSLRELLLMRHYKHGTAGSSIAYAF
ncbi:hypothetical protein [Paenibacillus solani]|uniref:hypothetical protein n=1 Tax=Paenibacillus solani TaxID=1705565 RepID=UPI003D2BCE0E